jgi:hypothetical protein
VAVPGCIGRDRRESRWFERMIAFDFVVGGRGEHRVRITIHLFFII